MTGSSEIDWNCIEEFVGYGRHDAPVVFIGLEEGFGGTDLEAELRHRSSYTPVIDIWEPRRLLDPSFNPSSLPLQATWEGMCEVMLRREGVANTTADQLRMYQNTKLGCRDGDTLLTELLPYPHRRVADWDYAGFGRYGTRPEYEKVKLPKRIKLLRALIDQAPRDLIICYGKRGWRYFEQMFDDATWEDRTRSIRVAEVKGTLVILTYHFTSREFNSKESFANFARIAFAE